MIKVQTKEELRDIIEKKEIPLDTLDVSAIRDMSNLFEDIKEINGSISNWNVSNVINMASIFRDSDLNEDISKWDVSSVTNMEWMFSNASFNQDISKWDVSKVIDMSYMFNNSIFNQDISSWNISNVEYILKMFENSFFNHNLGAWDLENKYANNMFKDTPYSMEKHKKDREKYLSNLELEKQAAQKIINEKYLVETKDAINKDLSKDIELDVIEMEF